MLNDNKNIQIDNLLDEEILKFTKNNDYFFTENKSHNFYEIPNKINYRITPYYKKNYNITSLNNNSNHHNNQKVYDLKSNKNISYKHFNTSNEIMENTINILNMDIINKKKSRNGNIITGNNKNKNKLLKAKSFSYMNTNNKNKIINNTIKDKSTKRTNEISNINNHNFNNITNENNDKKNLNNYSNNLVSGNTIKKVQPVKCSSKEDIWKNNCLMIKKEIDNIKIQIKKCTKNINDIENRLDKIRKFERNGLLEEKKVIQTQKKIKKLKVQYELSETIRKKQIDLINTLSKKINNLKSSYNHFQ